jgi:hypothetical protein
MRSHTRRCRRRSARDDVGLRRLEDLERVGADASDQCRHLFAQCVAQPISRLQLLYLLARLVESFPNSTTVAPKHRRVLFRVVPTGVTIVHGTPSRSQAGAIDCRDCRSWR